MQIIELSVKISVPFHIGQKVKTDFYEKFEEKYESRMLGGTIKDIRIEYSMRESKVETLLVVETNYNGKTFTTDAMPADITA